MSRPASELRVRPDVVEARRRQLGLGQKDLGASDRTYRDWLSGKAITLPMAEELSRRLGLGIAEVVTGLPPEYIVEAADDEEELSVRARRLRDQAVGGALLAESGKLRRYIKRIGLRFVPLRGFAYNFEHKGIDRHYYAALTITPVDPATNASFVFSYGLGPLRIDYGEVATTAGYARLRTFFAATGDPAVPLAPDGSFTVWTWFGKDRCRFLVRSRQEFTTAISLEPTRKDASKRPPDVLCFHAAPHHLEEAR